MLMKIGNVIIQMVHFLSITFVFATRSECQKRVTGNYSVYLKLLKTLSSLRTRIGLSIRICRMDERERKCCVGEDGGWRAWREERRNGGMKEGGRGGALPFLKAGESSGG